MDPKSPGDLAAFLLAVGGFRHYGWALFPPDLAGVASKGLGGLAILALIFAILASKESLLCWAVGIWWAFEEAQVVLCSALWMVNPWHVPKGQAMCSARVGFDIGALSVIIVAALALAVNTYSRHNSKGSQNA